MLLKLKVNVYKSGDILQYQMKMQMTKHYIKYVQLLWIRFFCKKKGWKDILKNIKWDKTLKTLECLEISESEIQAETLEMTHNFSDTKKWPLRGN